MECDCPYHRSMLPGHMYAAFQNVWDDFGTIRVADDLWQFLADEAYLWRAPTDEEWDAMVKDFHQHYEQRKKWGER
jgi:hypothetical protein